MKNWTEAYAGRLQTEIEAFGATEGLDFVLDEAERATSGLVVFRGTLNRDNGASVKLEVRYPDSFPQLRPEVFAHELRLGRHQNPYRHNLCLLERSSRHWSPSKTGAWLVAERVPLLLDLVDGDPDEMRRQEAPQGEPASYYFPRQESTAVFVPEDMLSLPEDVRVGTARFGVAEHETRQQLLRCCLTRVEERGEGRGKPRVLAQANERLAQRFGKAAYEGRWVRLDQFPPGTGTAEELFAAARAVPGYRQPPRQTLSDGEVRILGVVCKEEVRQGVWEDSWLFAVRIKVREGQQQREGFYIARGERLSSQDLGERIPTIAGLQAKTVALAGLGALGAPIAMELGRAQIGELRLLDHDYVEAGTIVRWPFGLDAVGHPKAGVLEHQLANNYPFTHVRSFAHAIGAVAGPGETPGRSESEVLTDFFDGVDILIDATAEIGVQQLLSSLADECGIPQVYVTATEGGWGGIVARVVPDATGCWYCLQLQLDHKSIKPPPLAEAGTVQPRGCAAATWTGTSFDALPIVAQAVRAVTFTLLGGRAAVDPKDVFVCAQQAETIADLEAPAWTSYALNRSLECPVCGDQPT